MKKIYKMQAVLLAACVFTGLAGCGREKSNIMTITNVSYDATRLRAVMQMLSHLHLNMIFHLLKKPDLLTAAGSRNMTMIPHHTRQQWSFL